MNDLNNLNIIIRTIEKYPPVSGEPTRHFSFVFILAEQTSERVFYRMIPRE
ncbi:MAG: hypothetical protein LBO21_08665 [Synergistaceae bacterium]|nr:hypothetical protein [Synergistaceae bacterium]